MCVTMSQCEDILQGTWLFRRWLLCKSMNWAPACNKTNHKMSWRKIAVGFMWNVRSIIDATIEDFHQSRHGGASKPIHFGQLHRSGAQHTSHHVTQTSVAHNTHGPWYSLNRLGYSNTCPNKQKWSINKKDIFLLPCVIATWTYPRIVAFISLTAFHLSKTVLPLPLARLLAGGRTTSFTVLVFLVSLRS